MISSRRLHSITPSQLIQRKRDGIELEPEQIENFISGIVDGSVADYQASAFLMAVYFKGMTTAETVALTRAMMESGSQFSLSSLKGPRVDKHSTGGIGDKISVPLAPLAASCGLKVPMMAGRGLGHSGGTIDKLEAIKGFRVELSEKQFTEVLAREGCAIIAQSKEICPADRILYALRDVTATVESLPLIVASILSKKAAEGTQGLILDVKVGNGAFMKSLDQARRLAKALVAVGNHLGLNVRALITDMNQPLGAAVGNSLEILESLDLLSGGQTGLLAEYGEAPMVDSRELTLTLCSHMLSVGGAAKNMASARKSSLEALNSGEPLEKFGAMVQLQGGDLDIAHAADKLSISKKQLVLKAKRKGYVTGFETQKIGELLIQMGGGRIATGETIDSSVGFIFHKKQGASVRAGEPLATLFLPEKLRDGRAGEAAMDELARLIQVGASRKAAPKLVYEVIGK